MRKRRLAYADGHALPILAARAHTRVEREVVADHGHLRQRIRAVADQRRALDRIGDLPSSIIYASAAENTNLPLVMSTCPPPKFAA